MERRLLVVWGPGELVLVSSCVDCQPLSLLPSLLRFLPPSSPSGLPRVRKVGLLPGLLKMGQREDDTAVSGLQKTESLCFLFRAEIMPYMLPLLMLSSPRDKTFLPYLFPAMPILSSKPQAVSPHSCFQLKTSFLDFSGHMMSSSFPSPPSFPLTWLCLFQANHPLPCPTSPAFCF